MLTEERVRFASYFIQQYSNTTLQHTTLLSYGQSRWFGYNTSHYPLSLTFLLFGFNLFKIKNILDKKYFIFFIDNSQQTYSNCS